MSVSVREVAERAGVSVGTVSNVINSPSKVRGPTAERVHQAIAELGWVRNDAARQLRAGRSRSIGLVVLDVGNPFFTDVARGIERRAALEGIAVLLANSDEDLDREADLIDLFDEQRVRGLIISPLNDLSPRLLQLRARGIPAVLLDRNAQTPDFPSVAVDDRRGGRLAVEHLLQQGRRHILFVGGPLDLGQVRDRLRGARDAMANVPSARLEVLPIAALSLQHGVAAGRDLISLASPPDAVFAANDLVALGVQQGAMLNGDLRVPQDLAIVGYDDIAYAAAAAVPLTSVRQPRELIGSTAFELLMAEWDGASRNERRQIVLQPELVVRQSTLP